MADDWMKGIACRYYKNGLCREGDNCKYQHASTSQQSAVNQDETTINERGNNESTDNSSSSTSNNGALSLTATTALIACRFFKWGTCKFGSRCHYNHNNPVTNNTNTVISEEEQQQPQLNESESSTSSSTSSSSSLSLSSSSRQLELLPCSSNTTLSSSIVSRDCTQAHSSMMIDAPLFYSTESSNLNTSDNLNTSKLSTTNDEWIKAPEFIPQSSLNVTEIIHHDTAGGNNNSLNVCIEEDVQEFKNDNKYYPETYAKAVQSNSNNSGNKCSNSASDPLCPYAESSGICKKFDCPYLHGDICELCSRAALHPFNKEQRQQHNKACIKQHEMDMELSFAIQRSRGKTCGVCFEVIMEKTSREQRRFGILPNCNHCFCLSCIRKWRQAKQFDNKIIRSCPECRIASDFVCPSIYWVDTKEEKEKLIVEYKGALSQKDCKYFNKGQGKCPFGNKCFYLHALPDGTKTDVGPPSRQVSNSNGNNLLHQLILWNFLEERDNRWIYMDEHDEVVVLFSDSDESDWSDWPTSSRYGSS